MIGLSDIKTGIDIGEPKGSASIAKPWPDFCPKSLIRFRCCENHNPRKLNLMGRLF